MEADNSKKDSSVICWIIALVTIPGTAFSIYLLNLHTLISRGLHSGQSVCNISARINCDVVAQSEYATIFNIPQASFGVVFYLSLLVLALLSVRKRFLPEKAAKDALLIAGLGAVVYSVILFVISEFIVKSVCIMCVGMYVVNFALLGIALYWGRGEAILGRIKNGIRSWCLLPLSFFRVLKSENQLVRRRVIFAIVCELAILYFTWQAPNVMATIAKLGNKAPMLNIEFDFSDGLMRDYYKGNGKEPIEVVVFSDIQCPSCRRFHVFLHDLSGEFPGQLKIVFKNYPLDHHCNPLIPKPYHLNACYAAELARCAGEQGKYWAALDLLYALPVFGKKLPVRILRKNIEEAFEVLALDNEAVQECMRSDRHISRIRKDIKQGSKLKIKGTPTVFVNGKRVPPSKENLRMLFKGLLSNEKETHQHPRETSAK